MTPRFEYDFSEGSLVLGSVPTGNYIPGVGVVPGGASVPVIVAAHSRSGGPTAMQPDVHRAPVKPAVGFSLPTFGFQAELGHHLIVGDLSSKVGEEWTFATLFQPYCAPAQPHFCLLGTEPGLGGISIPGAGYVHVVGARGGVTEFGPAGYVGRGNWWVVMTRKADKSLHLTINRSLPIAVPEVEALSFSAVALGACIGAMPGASNWTGFLRFAGLYAALTDEEAAGLRETVAAGINLGSW